MSLTPEQLTEARPLGTATLHEAAGRIGALPFPVFSHGVCIRGTIKGFDAAAWLDQPVHIGEVTVRPGDLVMGDRDGVVVLPAARAADALDTGARREFDEAEKIDRIRAGERTIDCTAPGLAADAFRLTDVILSGETGLAAMPWRGGQTPTRHRQTRPAIGSVIVKQGRHLPRHMAPAVRNERLPRSFVRRLDRPVGTASMKEAA